MNLSDYINDQKRTRSRWFNIRMRWFISTLLILLTAIIISYIYRVELLRIGSSVLNSVQAKDASKDFTRKAKLIEIEAESRAAYRADIVWVEVSREQQPALSKICLDYVPIGTALSFTGTSNGNIKACIPSKYKDQILDKMKQTKMQNKLK